ncbi:MAG TPA: dTDP-4-dehydrorhamnose reductase [Planctomycetota bacterium]|nr:dTDP-4-dehydrorhamnose reductase [Planctomycetota bacterium]
MNDVGPRRVLVTGAAGMLGSQLLRSAPPGVVAVGTDLAPGVEHPGVDLADRDTVEALLERAGPLAGVLHAAAYTAVDRAEAEPALAERVNATACEVLARAAAARDVALVVVGTDFVFDGLARTPYGTQAEPAPLSVYGRTKLAGERVALAAHPAGTAVVRTQWLYGPRGNHFPRTIVGLARERGSLRVVDDQVGSPTTTLELAPALWDVWRLGGRGVYHAACEGECSWHGLTAALLEELGLDDVRLEPCSTAEFPRPARRPTYSVLDSSRLAELRGRTLAPWRKALCDYLEEDPL